MLSVAATYVFTMVLPYIKIGDVGYNYINDAKKIYFAIFAKTKLN